MNRISSPIVAASTPESALSRRISASSGDMMNNLIEEANSEDEFSSGRANRSLSAHSKLSKTKNRPSTLSKVNVSEDETDDEEDEFENEHGPTLEGVYNPADYQQLQVSDEIKDLFQFISRYAPQAIELEHKLKPFIPELIPAVGDIDAFIKIIRPDKKEESLGLTILDEPSLKQSDPTVLDLQLRAISKENTSKTIAVKTLADAEKNVKEIDKWIKSISDLHRSKPPPAVHYSRHMPSIDSLMQEWNPHVEELLKQINLPTAELDTSLEQFIDIICNLLDIPVYNSRIQSLHLLFSLYLAFKKNQHFQNQGRQAAGEEQSFGDETVDHLILN